MVTSAEKLSGTYTILDWKKTLFFICTIFAVISLITDFLKILPSLDSSLLALIAVAAGGSPILVGGVKAFLHKKLNVDFLASIAIIGAVIVNQFIAASLVALMLTGGELLEDYTAGRTSRAIQMLIESAPKTAYVRRDGKEYETPIENVQVGDIVLVRSGEEIPVDGEVISGQASVNQATITGESIPVDKTVNCPVLTGTLVELGALEIRVDKVGEDTAFAKIIKLIKEGESNRAPIEKIADRYSRWFAPILLGIVVISYAVTRNVTAAVSTLVIACPCALTLATPTAVVASIGNAAKKGMLIRGGVALETVGNIDTVFLDKTGTLTLGLPKVLEVKSFDGRPPAQIIELAAVAEKFSEHSIAKAVLEKAKDLCLSIADPTSFQVVPGQGVIAQYKHQRILVGNERLASSQKISLDTTVRQCVDDQKALGRTVFIISENDAAIALISVADISKHGVTESISSLRKLGVKKVVMLTGDNSQTATAIAKIAGVDEVGSGLLPHEKADYVKRYKEEGAKILMVGDGVNDAPALSSADVGLAMGKAGTDIAIEAANIVLIGDDISKVPKIIETGKRTTRLIRQNILIAMTINVLGVVLAASGYIPPVLAAGIHEGNALFVVLNSTRLFWMK